MWKQAAKRTIALLLVLCLALGGFPALALEANEGTIAGEDVRVRKGETATVVYHLTANETNPVVASFWVFLKYDNTLLTYNEDATTNGAQSLSRKDIYVNPSENFKAYAGQIRLMAAAAYQEDCTITVPFTNVQGTSKPVPTVHELQGKPASAADRTFVELTCLQGDLPTIIMQNPVAVSTTANGSVSVKTTAYEADKDTYDAEGSATDIAAESTSTLYVDTGADQQTSPVFTITPEENSVLSDILVNGRSVGATAVAAAADAGSYTLSTTDAVAENASISFQFKKNISNVTVKTMSLVGGAFAESTAAGTVTYKNALAASAALELTETGNYTFTLTPTDGYYIAKVVLDGTEDFSLAGTSAATTYQLAVDNLTEDHTLAVYFSNVDIDTDGDGDPDLNVDTSDPKDGKPDVNIDTDGDGKPDKDIDTDGDGEADLDKDTDGNGIPDTDVDIDGDGFPDVNIDTNGDGKPDTNLDKDVESKLGDPVRVAKTGNISYPEYLASTGPELNVDTNGAGKWVPSGKLPAGHIISPDKNLDTDGDGVADIAAVNETVYVPSDENGDGVNDLWNPETDMKAGSGYEGSATGTLNPVDVDTSEPKDGKPDLNIDTSEPKDGIPDVNIDTDLDGKADLNIDTDGDGDADLDVDTDGDGEADLNVDTSEPKDGKPDVNIDTDEPGDGKPDVNIDTDGDGDPDTNKDTDGDGIPDTDVDIDGDGKPDVNIDTDGDGKPDTNLDKDVESKLGTKVVSEETGFPTYPDYLTSTGPQLNVDTDPENPGTWVPSSQLGEDHIISPDKDIDIDGDGEPDVDSINETAYVPVDEDGDGINDKWTPGTDMTEASGYEGSETGMVDTLNTDTSDPKDGKPDLNIDTDGDGDPDVNIDTDYDGKPDLNIDTDGDGDADVDIDTDGDGKADLNVDTSEPKDGKPDLNIDTDGDGKADLNVDTDGDGDADLNVDTSEPKDGKPDVNIDTDGDGIPDTNKDTDGDGEADLDKDTDGNGVPDVNVDVDGDGKPDVNIDTDGDGKPDTNLDKDVETKLGDKVTNPMTKQTLYPAYLTSTGPQLNVDTDPSVGKWVPSGKLPADHIVSPDKNLDTDGDGEADVENIDETVYVPVDEDDDGVNDKWAPGTDMTSASGYEGSETGMVDTLNTDTSDPKDGKPDLNIDTDGDGDPDVNIDTDYDGKPDLNIDTDGDGDADVDIDTDGDGEADLNVDTSEPKDGKPDINIDTDGDGMADKDIDTDGDGEADLNVDTDGNGVPDTNVDVDGDGKPDVNIDTDGDGKPDVNLDKDVEDNLGTLTPDPVTKKPTYPDYLTSTGPQLNVDTDPENPGTWVPSGELGEDHIISPDKDIDTDGDGEPDIDSINETVYVPVDEDGDGVNDKWTPDTDMTKDSGYEGSKTGVVDTLDTDTSDPKDGKPDLNIDTDDDGDPDVNIDTDYDGKPDLNIDTDGDGEPDLNVDTDGDGKADLNVDTDGDGEADLNVDTSEPKDGKPDINIDTDDDGVADKDIDTDGDGEADLNVDTDDNGVPDTNVDVDGDGKPDVNIDTDGDGKPDVNLDKDVEDNLGTLTPDPVTKKPTYPDYLTSTGPQLNVDTDPENPGTWVPSGELGEDHIISPDKDIDTDGDGEPDIDSINETVYVPVDEDGDGVNDKWTPDTDMTPDSGYEGSKTGVVDTLDTDTSDPKDGKPDLNIDTDGDGDPDVNIDTDYDGEPDKNIDTDGDGKADLNVDTDGDGEPDKDIDTDGDGKADLNVDTDGNGIPDTNVDVDGDGKPDVNIDTDGDGKPDVNLDKDVEANLGTLTPDPETKKPTYPGYLTSTGPQLNVDTDPTTGKWVPSGELGEDHIISPDTNVDTDGDGEANYEKINEEVYKPVDEDGDGVNDDWTADKDMEDGSGYEGSETGTLNMVDVDTDGDGDPDLNVDTSDPKDGIPDVNIDTDGDGKPDKDIDTDGDGKPDKDIDTDGDGKPDTNVDVDGDGIPDINVDTDGDGKPDTNLDPAIADHYKDANGDGLFTANEYVGKPTLNVDTNGTGSWQPSSEFTRTSTDDGIWSPDKNIDTDGDGAADIATLDRTSYPILDANDDGVDDNWQPDTEIAGTEPAMMTGNPTLNRDSDGDGKPDTNVDLNGDGKPDVNIDADGDGKMDTNIDPDLKDHIGTAATDPETGKTVYPGYVDGGYKPSINVDTNGTGTWTPSGSESDDGIILPDKNLDTNGDGTADLDTLDKEPFDANGDGVDDNWAEAINDTNGVDHTYGTTAGETGDLAKAAALVITPDEGKDCIVLRGKWAQENSKALTVTDITGKVTKNSDITWSIVEGSSAAYGFKEDCISIDSTGTVRTLKSGITEVEGTYNGKTGKITIIVPGDYNRDGRINTADATMAVDVAAGDYDLDTRPYSLELLDLIRNGSINTADASALVDVALEDALIA